MYYLVVKSLVLFICKTLVTGSETVFDCCLLFLLCRDKTKPNSAFAPENLTILPGEKDLEPTLGEQVATWLRSFRK